MIHVGVDLHQRFCYCTAMKASGEVLAQRSVPNEAGSLQAFLRSLPGPRQVVVEACGFWPAFQKALGQEADRVVMVHPQRVKAIAHAKLKNDKVDSATLAQLSRCDLLPEAWMADEATQQARQRVRLRVSLGRQRTRSKNLLHAVLHQEGVRAPVSDVFGKRGRAWLQAVALSAAAAESVASYLEVIDVLDRIIGERQRQLEATAASDARVRWLQTIPGVGAYLAALIVAELGDAHRFRNGKAVASYAGLVPRVRESAGKRRSGPITRCGSPLLRWALVQAAHGATRSSPVIAAWYERLKKRKRPAVARTALARKLLIAAWALLRHGVVFEESVFATV
jgi:transposase